MYSNCTVKENLNMKSFNMDQGAGKPDMPKSLYSSGEFARLNGVNKRTLHYYHEIGLFHPAVIGENGYHYYTCFQSVELELIRMLGKLGVPLETIKSYREHPSHTSFSQIAMHQKQLIDHSMEQLMAARAFLQKKSDKLELGMKARHGSVELSCCQALFLAGMTKRTSPQQQNFLSAFAASLACLTALEAVCAWNQERENTASSPMAVKTAQNKMKSARQEPISGLSVLEPGISWRRSMKPFMTSPNQDS